MCDWTYAAYAVLTAASANSAEQQRKGASQARTDQREAMAKADADKAKVEADAVQNANARLAATQQRRRQQNNLLARGDTGTAPAADSVITTTKAPGGPGASLVSRGAPGAAFYGT